MKKYILIACFLFFEFLNAQEGGFSIKNLNANSKYQDFGTTIVRDSLVVFASSRNRKSIRKNVWDGNSQPFLELYKGKIADNGEIVGVELLAKEINSKFHDANVSFTKDYKTIYFTRGNHRNKKLIMDTLGWNLNQLYKAPAYGNGKFGEIESMPFNNDNYQTGHPMLNRDGTKLYFISDMPGTLGLTDIFVVDIHKDGTYGKPQNLGPNVNTEGKEMFPYVDVDDVLYYASDGKENGYGGLDVYATQMVDGNAVNSSLNIGESLNSEFDDFGLVYQNGKNSGYFSSNREGGKGDDDLYYFKELKPLVFECSQLINGQVVDASTNSLLSNAEVLLYDESDVVVASAFSDADGKFSFEIACGQGYKISGTHEKYLALEEDFISNKHNLLEHNIILNIEPEFVQGSGDLLVNIPSIYFDFDKAEIRKDAAKELQKVVEIMNKYPEIIIEYRSHSDSRGKDSYNLWLSNERAISSAKWIVENGISRSRISGKGYGESQLVNKCSNGVPCSKEEHQLNRRSEFVITNPEKLK